MANQKANNRNNGSNNKGISHLGTFNSGLSAVKNFVSSDDSSEFGALADKLKFAQESAEAADEARKAKISESLEEDIQGLVGELKKLIEKNKKLEAECNKKLSRVNVLEDVAEQKKKEVEQKEKDLEKDEKQLSSDKKKMLIDLAEIANRMREIEDKELDAECGFSNKNIEMLEKFKVEKESFNAKLENRRSELQKQISKLEETKGSLSDEENKLFKEKMQRLLDKEKRISDKEQNIEDKALQIAQREVVLGRKLQRLEMSESDAKSYKNELRQEVRDEYLHQIQSLENSKAVLAEQIEKYRCSEKGLQKQLNVFGELQRKFGDSSAEQVLSELEESKVKLFELKAQLDAKPSEQLEASYKILKKEHQDLEQSLFDTQSQLAQMKTQLHKNMRSVVELEQMNMQKQALEKHNELLKVRLDQLKEEVDELLSKQQSKSAFPALLNLDSKYRANSLTEAVPSLKVFARELQHRIAWDAKEKKELYYRIEEIQLFLAGLAMSRLHILQGISGTGKTSLAKAFSRAIGGGCKTISVQAGWRDKGDLVGHYNAFEKKFYEQETLQGLYEAQCPHYSDRPYIILLDEMNLSRPEQYFAEFLSALELDPKDRIIPLMTTELPGGPELLIDGRKLKIPENVWFIGTANHDETTFEFADKTYDRAHIMELPRHRDTFEIDKTLDPITYSFESLEKAFEAASEKHRDKIKKLVEALNESLFSDCLENEFNVSWGNRLERHMLRFIPVVLESGGDLGFALDHVLATKILRAGKATGRYDTESSDISELIDCLDSFWKDQGFKTKPSASKRLLEAELKKKSDI